MNRFPSTFFAACGLLLFSSGALSSLSVRAQTTAVNTPTNVPDLAVRAPIAANIEGTVQLLRSGFTQTAQLKFSTPDSLSVHVLGDVSHLSADEIYVAQGNSEKTYSADLQRVRQWRWSSVREPWRSQVLADGGPANIWLWGWNPARITPFYTVATSKSGDVTTVVLTAKPAGARQVRDTLRSGGRGDRLFYAPFKQTVYDWPRRVVLKLNTNNAPTYLEKRDERNRVLETIAYTWNASGWPVSATTRDGNNHVTAQWKYDLKAATQPFSSDAFDLNKATNGASANQIVEDVEPLPLADYAQKTDADALYNRGVVEATHVEDYGAAFADWGLAATAQPQAIAPLEAAFDTALSLRDWRRATTILQPLSALLKSDDPALLSRRVRLAALQRDWATALSTLAAAEKTRPTDWGLRLQRASLQLLGGDTSGAQTLLTSIIAEPTQQLAGQSNAFGDGVQAAAAQLLARTLSLSYARDQALSMLQTLPKATTAQRLARSLIALQLGQNPETANFDNDAAQATWANAQAAAGKTDDAVASWQIVAQRASLDASYEAHRNLMGLFARRGDVSSSRIEYSKVAVLDIDEDARSRTRNALFEAWRKAGQSETLRRALQARSSAAGSTEDDARLWLAWQENNASSAAIGETVRAFATRYAKSAWWQSRLGEQLVSEAAALDKHDDMGRARLTSLALTAVRRAIALDSTQPYYPVQAALILTLRANDFRKAAIGDATSTTDAVDAARQELDNLRQSRGNDADISLAIAFAGQALSSNYPNVVELLQSGLEGGLPGRESVDGDRHPTTFAARQALAIALRHQGQFSLATQQNGALITAARDPGEELGIAINLMLTLKDADAKNPTSSTGNAPSGAARGAAQLMARLSSEAWPLEDADSSARSFAGFLQNDSTLWQQAAAILRASSQPDMQLGAAYFFFSLENTLSSMAKSPKNAPDMQKYLDDLLQKTRVWSSEAEAKIAVLADGSDAILASRASSLLGGRALSRSDFGEAIRRLQNAVALEPDSVEMRFALARAFVAAGRPDDALQIRNAMLQALPPDSAMLNRLATLSTKLNHADDSLQESQLAWNLSASPDVSSGDAQRAGFLLARNLISKNRFADAQAIYTNLSSTGWDFVGRVVALSDAEANLRAAGQTAAANAAKTQLASLQASELDMQRAQTFLASLSQ